MTVINNKSQVWRPVLAGAVLVGGVCHRSSSRFRSSGGDQPQVVRHLALEHQLIYLAPRKRKWTMQQIMEWMAMGIGNVDCRSSAVLAKSEM